MSTSLSRSIVAALVGSALAVSAFGQNSPRLTVRPQVRVIDTVDAKKSTVLANTAPAVVASAIDNGRLASTTAMPHMKLVLKSSDEQEAALRGLLDDQQDKSSANYHKWMTPDTFATTFGPASTDITKVSSWLQDAGFAIESVSAGGRVIEFSGNAGQVETAFKTEMHRITLNGESHISNTKDISVPSALAPVVTGVASLNDFHPHSKLINPRQMLVGKDGKLYPVAPGTTDTPDYTSLSSGNHYVGPADLQKIYNGSPLRTAGIDGTGVTIGIIGQSSISLANVQTYRQMFALPVNDPVFVNVGAAPAVIGDDIESDLDVELSGALATGAKIRFYTASISLVDSGVDTSALAAVDDNISDIISLSYGGCELSNAAAGTAYWNTLWEQAAAQGQTVFVSTGDSSATGCASSSAALATGSTAGSYGVNALGSGAYNVAVGGSMFNEGATATTTGPTAYWGPGGISPYGTALSYIPENVWSEGKFDPVQAEAGIGGGGGGVSIFTARPAWQVGPGIGADPAGPTFTAAGAIPAAQLHRLVPDVSLIAAGDHDGTIFCSEGVCKLNADGSVAGIGVVGGTSVATPTMAGVQALINQKNGGRQGNANYYYYKLAAASATAGLDCTSSSATSKLPAAGCNFNDIVQGNNYSPKTNAAGYNVATGTTSGVLGTDYIGFQAAAGYDVASGLGTPNITNIANNWKSVTFNASKTSLTLSPTTTTHGTAISFTISVASTATTPPGTPTGQVSLIAVAQSAGAGDGTFYTLDASGNVTGTITSLPGGTYNVIARYTGDSIFGASDSSPVSVTISKEDSNTFIYPYNITTAGAVNAATTFAYGTSIYLDTEIQGKSMTGYTSNGGVPNTGVPTGTLAFSLVSGTTTLPGLTTTLDSVGTTYLEVAQTFTNFEVFANYPAISPAAYTLTATYSGDNSFNTSKQTQAFTVVKASVNPVLTATTATIASGDTASFSTTIAASGGGVLPTGTVTLTDNTTSTVLGTGTLTNGAVVITSNLITTNGAHSIVAAYGGDANYNATTSTAKTVTVGGTATSLTIGASTSATKVLASVTFTATIPTGVTGTVYFYDNGTKLLGSGAISTTTHLATLTLVTLPAGIHNVTAQYAGSTTYSAATSAATIVTVSQNTPALSFTSQQANSSTGTVGMSATLTPSPAAPATAAGANPAPTGSIQFMDGTTVLGTAPITYTPNYLTYSAAYAAAPLKPGPHSLTAVYPGDANYATVTSAAQPANIGLTTTTLTSPVTTIGTGTPLSATVAAQVANTKAFTGTVTFSEGATTLGTATVSASGVATLGAGVYLANGVHTITAVYSGDSNYYTSTITSAVTITSLTPAPAFTISVSPATLTIYRGASGTLSLSSTATGNYNGFANVTCTGLPVNAICAFSQTSIGLPGTNGTKTQGTLTVFASQQVAANRTNSTSAIRSAGLLWIPALFLAGFLALRRKQLSLLGRQLMVLGILLCGMMATTGCNEAITASPVGTPTGTSTVTVVATSQGVTAASPNITATTTFQLTVQ